MRKLFTEPTMEIKRFRKENILTASGDVELTEVSAENIKSSGKKYVSIDAIKDLEFVL